VPCVRLWDKMLAMGHLLPLIALATATMAAQDTGALLVATEASHDTDFARTVVLILDHDVHRATGLVLNRPVKISLAEVFPELKTGPALVQTAWAGGPVLLGVNTLLRSRTTRAGLDRVLPGVYLIVDKQRMRAEIAAGTAAASFRVYLGMCGWGAGQLESEIRRGLWRAVPGSADLVFDAKPDTLWERLRLRRVLH
jgi:putative transcriptional regulator